MFETSVPWLHLCSYNACPCYLKSRRDLLWLFQSNGVRVEQLPYKDSELVNFSFLMLMYREEEGEPEEGLIFVSRVMILGLSESEVFT